MIEKRKFIRLKAPIGVAYKLVKKNVRPRTYASFSKDIGGGGVRIFVKEELRSGDLLELQIRIPHLEEPIRAIGEVMWYAVSKDRANETREAGVRFRDIDPGDLHAILEFVHTVGIG